MSKSLLFAALAAISASFCFGQVPQTLSYQGLLTNNTGVPLEGTQSVNFKFYTSLTGGSAIPGSTRGPITVETFKGLFTTVIGDGSSNNAALAFSLADQKIFVEIILGSNPDASPLSPRVEITAVPYAFAAQVANSVKSVDPSILSSAVPLTKGGTGSTTAGGVRTNLGLVIGTDVQAYNAALGQIRYNATEKVMEYNNGSDWLFMTPKICILKDEKNKGISGGNGIGSDWNKRSLNTSIGDKDMLVGFAEGIDNSAFTLRPGKYIIEVSAPAHQVWQHQLKLTAGGSDVAWSPNVNDTESQTNPLGTSTFSNLYYLADIAVATAFQIDHFLVFINGQPYHMGAPTLTSYDAGTKRGDIKEVYTQVKITKLR